MPATVSLMDGVSVPLARPPSGPMALCYPLLVLRSSAPPQNALLLCDLTRPAQSPMTLLSAHQRPIDALSFNVAPHASDTGLDNPSFQLCTVSRDVMLLWDIIRTPDTFDAQSHPILRDCGDASFITFDPTGTMIGLAADNTFDIFQISTSKHMIRLEGHEQRITCAVFGGRKNEFLVTCSEDRSFKVWNLLQRQLVYQSGILSMSPLLSLAIDPDHERFVVGSADGKIRFYKLDPSNGHGGRCLRELNLHSWFSARLIKEQEEQVDSGPIVISSVPPWKQMAESIPPEDEILPQKPEVDCPILYLHFLPTAAEQTPRATDVNESVYSIDQTIQRDLTKFGSQLLVGTTVGLVQVDSQTQEPVCVLDYSTLGEQTIQSPAPSSSVQASSSSSSSISFSASNYSICPFTDSSQSDDIISVFPSKPPPPNSYLMTDFLVKLEPKAEDKPVRKIGRSLSSATLKDKVPKVADKPVTFHSRVKSSGYGAAPVIPSKSKTTLKRSGSSGNLLEKKYPVNCGAPHVPQPRASLIPPHSGAILRLAYSSNGEKIVSCGSDKVTREIKLPLAKFKGEGTDYRGHGAPVVSVAYNQKNEYLLTSSADRTVRLWGSGNPDPLINFRNVVNNTKDDARENPEFSSPIRQARFYYMDKFVLLCCGNKLMGYKYLIEETPKDDLLRFQNNNKYKLAVKLSSEAQSITDFACANTFLSHIAICSSSDKSLTVFDMATKSIARRIPEAHTRPIHSVRMCENSQYVSHSPESYELFLTAATDNCVKLWDLRANRFEGHMNRIHEIGIAFSPCLRFLACGSEDKAAYLYDLRKGTVLHKIVGHTDTVTDVAFHPLHPQLATSCLDGKVRMFNEKDSGSSS